MHGIKVILMVKNSFKLIKSQKFQFETIGNAYLTGICSS